MNAQPGLASVYRGGKPLVALGLLAAVSLVACAHRPVQIPAPKRDALAVEQIRATGEQETAAMKDPAPAHRLHGPDSRASVLRLLTLFQSSIASGEPPLDGLLTGTTTLSAPGADGRRTAPSRANIASLLDASFLDRNLDFDPLEVSVRSTERGATATVPVQVTGSAGRRMLLALGLGYRDGTLRIVDIALVRAP